MVTKEHFYHVGAKEANRNAVFEALITNFITPQSFLINSFDPQKCSKSLSIAAVSKQIKMAS